MTFAEKFKAAREQRGLTQQQVAEAVGISQVQVCRLEKRALAALAARLVR